MARQVEIFSDVLCPWCYLGKRRIAAALSRVADRGRYQVIWRSYELGPDAGRVPGPTAAEAMVGWLGDRAEARVVRIHALGAAEGLALDLHSARPVNTFDAHRLSHLAAERGLADEVLESLFHAYHVEGLNVADPQVLHRLATGAGLDATEVDALLHSDTYAESVRADERRAAELGVTGVPSVVIDDRPPISGVLSPEELRRALEQ